MSVAGLLEIQIYVLSTFVRRRMSVNVVLDPIRLMNHQHRDAAGVKRAYMSPFWQGVVGMWTFDRIVVLWISVAWLSKLSSSMRYMMRIQIVVIFL